MGEGGGAGTGRVECVTNTRRLMILNKNNVLFRTTGTSGFASVAMHITEKKGDNSEDNNQSTITV